MRIILFPYCIKEMFVRQGRCNLAFPNDTRYNTIKCKQQTRYVTRSGFLQLVGENEKASVSAGQSEGLIE